MRPQHSTRLRRIRPKIANEIRRYRLQAGFTQRQLAKELGVRLTTFTSWERGNACPSLQNIFRLARKLDTLAEGLYPDFYVIRRERQLIAPAA